MRRMIAIAIAVAFLFSCLFGTSVAIAQDGRDEQTRIVVHPTVDISDHWFVANWAIGNAKLDSPNNINLFEGVGYRGSSWWLESMVQHQWSSKKNLWLLDFRFQTQVGKRGTLFAEASPILGTRNVYDFVTFDYRAWKKLNVGAETENVHKAGRDSLGAGPRVSYPLGSIGKTKVAVALTYQFRRQEPDVPRLYVVFNHRFSSR